MTVSQARGITWESHNNLSIEGDRWTTNGPDPFAVSAVIDPPIDAKRSYAVLRFTVSKPGWVDLRWAEPGGGFNAEGLERFHVATAGQPVTYVVDLHAQGQRGKVAMLRLDPADDAGVDFELHALDFVERSELPEDALPALLGFQCFTAKLHFLAGEAIPYRAVFNARPYPDRKSSKILRVWVEDESGTEVARDVQHYGIPPVYNQREIQGILALEGGLPQGKYLLKAESVDQKTGLRMESTHQFGVLGADDVYIYETPFKFVKDYSLILGQDGLWHIFSITGEFFGDHTWVADGQERTFSHGTSRDLRHWTYHEPVLSIHDKPHPDGHQAYQDRNIWAPHVIEHQGRYYMFYTSINEHVSQSVSLAISDDLFHWEEYEENPVFTAEGLDFAQWSRTAWSDCRDPMVFADDDGVFYLYATARYAEDDPPGMVIVAESRDLIHWENPRAAVRHHHAMESPQVWKQAGRYYMTTSAHGGGTWTSHSPTEGWELATWQRPPTHAVDPYVPTSGPRTYAEEAIRLDDGRLILSGLTFRLWGNSIYLFEVEFGPDGAPAGYKSPFTLPMGVAEPELRHPGGEADR